VLLQISLLTPLHREVIYTVGAKADTEVTERSEMSSNSQQQPKWRHGVSSSMDITDGASKRKSLTTKAKLRMRTLSDDLTDPGSITLRSPLSSPEQQTRISIDKAVPTLLSLDFGKSRPRSATLGDVEKVCGDNKKRHLCSTLRKTKPSESFPPHPVTPVNRSSRHRQLALVPPKLAKRT
jgi:hypothetical protein